MVNEEKKYDDVIGTLKSLQKVKASPNFESDLKRRLNAGKYETSDEKTKRSFWVPSKLVPTFGLAVAAIVVIMLVDLNSEESDNPFLIEPKIREDLIAVTNEQVNEIPMRQIPETKEESKPEEMTSSDKKKDNLKMDNRSEENTGGRMMTDMDVTAPESTVIEESEIASTDELSTELATGIAIRKSGLNFRQINQTSKEKEEILELKKRVQIPKKVNRDK